MKYCQPSNSNDTLPTEVGSIEMLNKINIIYTATAPMKGKMGRWVRAGGGVLRVGGRRVKSNKRREQSFDRDCLQKCALLHHEKGTLRAAARPRAQHQINKLGAAIPHPQRVRATGDCVCVDSRDRSHGDLSRRAASALRKFLNVMTTAPARCGVNALRNIARRLRAGLHRRECLKFILYLPDYGKDKTKGSDFNNLSAALSPPRRPSGGGVRRLKVLQPILLPIAPIKFGHLAISFLYKSPWRATSWLAGWISFARVISGAHERGQRADDDHRQRCRNEFRRRRFNGKGSATARKRRCKSLRRCKARHHSDPHRAGAEGLRLSGGDRHRLAIANHGDHCENLTRQPHLKSCPKSPIGG
ncbi:hypothetical protein EVAR_65942_1 [Eumeta japonica]|uniref:Uncharacterized protein n=1 Tax=Eumeta variegata TaxID=151549 RepID=A0A4C1ZNH5_EUMVA|nr:hypothetical protein EVAR_65942_1 [Eumeta japonica]